MTPEQKAVALQLTADLCREFEGFRSEPYKCPAGVWTIGYGFTRYETGKAVTPTDPAMSKEQAANLLQHQLLRYQAGVLTHCPGIDSVPLLAACTDLAYNIGVTAFGKSTLCRYINEGRPLAEIAAQFRKWVRAGGVVLAGLVRRRDAEVALFLPG